MLPNTLWIGTSKHVHELINPEEIVNKSQTIEEQPFTIFDLSFSVNSSPTRHYEKKKKRN